MIISLISSIFLRFLFNFDIIGESKDKTKVYFYLCKATFNGCEGKLLNYCRDGVLCLEEDHAVNNRVEIKVLELIR